MLPALINPHHQAFLRMFRGIFDFGGSYSHLKMRQVLPLSNTVDPELFEAVVRVSLAEQALAGVGTVGEFHYLHNGATQESHAAKYAETLIEVALSMGLRLTLIYCFFDQDPAQNAAAFHKPLDISLKEFEALRQKYSTNPLIQVIPGLRSLKNCTKEAILAASRLADKYNTRFHARLAINHQELEFVKAKYGKSPLLLLEELGVLNENLILVGGNLLSPEELSLLQSQAVPVILCPEAAQVKGDSYPKVSELLEYGVPFAVGSGEVEMSHTSCIANEIKSLEFSERIRQGTTNILCSQADIDSLWELGSWLPGQLLGNIPGQLMPGSPADFILVRRRTPSSRTKYNFMGNHFVNELLLAWTSQIEVSHLAVQGKLLVANGAFFQDQTENQHQLAQWSGTFLSTLASQQV